MRFAPLFLGLIGATAPIAVSLQAALPTNDVVSLFNGNNLDGFYTWLVDSKHEDPRHVFTVTNGLIRISGEGLGYLATRTEFHDYRLVAEFKWGRTNWHWGDRIGKARDSGIFLHATGADGNSHDSTGAFMAAIECNLFQGATGDLLLIRGNATNGSLIAPRLTAEVGDERDPEGWFTWKSGGRRETIERWGRLNWFGKDPRWKDQPDFRGSRDIEKPSGEWNRVECICDGNRVRVILNGTVVNEASDIWPDRGKILLQCEGSEIFFRRLEIKPVDAVLSESAGRRIALTDGQLFVPANFKAEPDGIDLTLHLHGAAATVEQNFLRAKYPGVLVNVTLPGLSAVYADRFRDTNTFARILNEAGVQLKTPGTATGPRFRRVTVTSFSAGFGGVRELLKNEEAFKRIDVLVMADSIYAGYSGDPAKRQVDPEKMEGFLKFAREAVEGRKQMFITHSAQRPEGYASTTETADYLIAQLGGTRESVTEDWPGGLKLSSRLRKGGLCIYGFVGDAAGDHMRHLRNLSAFLDRPGE